MSCCADPRAVAPAPSPFAAALCEEAGTTRLTLHVPGIHCAGCIGRIEKAVAAADRHVAARVNFTRRTLTLSWPSRAGGPEAAIAAVRDLGYAPIPLDAPAAREDVEGRRLIRALAVAGFAAMNVMLLSVAVWAGADGATKAFLNWFAALVALPALAYSARPFVRSALKAIAAWTLNMDVPIALAIVLAACLSLTRTINGDGETYFDAAITLTFFLLAGRTLDHFTRERARQSVRTLAAFAPKVAHVLSADGSAHPAPLSRIVPGMALELAAGERVPVDGTLKAAAAFDLSLATGESRPVSLRAGDTVLAGALTLTGPVALTAQKPAADSFLATLAGLQAAAEEARSRPARLADRAARVYAPVVHLVALFTFLGWVFWGAGAAEALAIAIAVLIITCPCALGLAVPAVQVAASDRLFRKGLLIKDGGALERLRDIDAAIFDKTGTLTVPSVPPGAVPDADLAAAAALGRHATHPVSRAVLRAAAERGLALPPVIGVAEERGRGVRGTLLGVPAFLGASGEGLTLTVGTRTVPIPLEETIREGAADLVAFLKAEGVPVTILSGDAAPAVRRVADALGIDDAHAGVSAAQKLHHLERARAAGQRTLMVGDGLNDGPALSAAHASIAPAEASDLSRTAADIVMTGPDLSAAIEALRTARTAHRIIIQNFCVAAAYNAVAIPLAVLGHATPLMAAVVMSTSSILVTLNALRLTPRTAP
ncbi:MAG: heavy metal translocating P-type ATPase [Pseudomonadota bacterium]